MQNLTERDMAYDMLYGAKDGAMIYMTAALESASPRCREVFHRLQDDSMRDQWKLWRFLHDRKEYRVAQAPRHEVDGVRQRMEHLWHTHRAGGTVRNGREASEARRTWTRPEYAPVGAGYAGEGGRWEGGARRWSEAGTPAGRYAAPAAYGGYAGGPAPAAGYSTDDATASGYAAAGGYRPGAYGTSGGYQDAADGTTAAYGYGYGPDPVQGAVGPGAVGYEGTGTTAGTYTGAGYTGGAYNATEYGAGAGAYATAAPEAYGTAGTFGYGPTGQAEGAGVRFEPAGNLPDGTRFQSDQSYTATAGTGTTGLSATTGTNLNAGGRGAGGSGAWSQTAQGGTQRGGGARATASSPGARQANGARGNAGEGSWGAGNRGRGQSGNTRY